MKGPTQQKGNSADVQTWHNLASKYDALISEGRRKQAQKTAKKALRLAQTSIDITEPLIAISHRRMGDSLMKVDETDQAIKQYEYALSGLLQHPDAQDDACEVLSMLGTIALTDGDYAEFDRIAALTRKVIPKTNRLANHGLELSALMARKHMLQKKYNEARKEYDDLIPKAKVAFGDVSRYVAHYYYSKAQACHLVWDGQSATRYAEKSIFIYAQLGVVDDIRLVGSLEILAVEYLNMFRYPAAEESALRVKKIMNKHTDTTALSTTPVWQKVLNDAQAAMRR